MRILGLDFGSTSIKAVELESAFRGFEIHEYHEQPIPPEADPWIVAQGFLASLSKSPDRVVVALRASQATYRNLQLPTRDRKAIQASVGFELEDDLPFELEDAVYDSIVLSQTGNQSQVHVAATLRKYVEQAISNWNSAGIDPDLITTETWAYRTLFNRILRDEQQDQASMLLQIGHTRTILYVHHKGVPVLTRELPWGGLDLTLAISRKYGVDMEQAEKAKLEHGFVLLESQREQATAEQIEFSDTILEAIQGLLQEIRQAELVTKSSAKTTIGQIFISGGGSLLPGLARRIEEDLLIPIRNLQALSSTASSGVTYSEHTEAHFSLALAVALCQVGPERSSVINLRRGELARGGRTRDLNFAVLKKPLIAAGVLAAVLTGALMDQSNLYRTELEEVDTQLERGIRTLFGGLGSSVVRNYIASPSMLRNNIERELNQEREQAKLLSSNQHSPLAFLRELSSSIPKDLVVDMTQFQVGSSPASPYSQTESGEASLTFLLNSPQSADQLAGILDSKLSGTQRSNVEQVTLPDGAPRWKVTFTGKPNEASYGN